MTRKFHHKKALKIVKLSSLEYGIEEITVRDELLSVTRKQGANLNETVSISSLNEDYTNTNIF